MTNHSPVQTIRIDDLDQPLFRIFPLWFFEEALRLKSLAFVSPKLWPDPFEDICSNIIMSDRRKPGSPQKQLSDFLAPAYAQCWTFESNSDVLLRAYSRVRIDPLAHRNTEPALEGVRVRTTPGRLIAALAAASEKLAQWQFFVGSVRYGERNGVTQYIKNKLVELGAARVGQPANRAELLLYKVDAFRHEHEVRALATSRNHSSVPDILRIPYEPNELFDEVQFDPRLITFERREREERARKLGYSQEFGTREYPARILFQVSLPNGWGD